MTPLRPWRKRLFTAGWILLVLSGAALLGLSWGPALMIGPRPLFDFFLYGMFVAATLSLIFVLFGAGWKRWALGILALADAYLWFSFIAMMVRIS